MRLMHGPGKDVKLTMNIPQVNPTVSLVLSSGGARGLVHIGVIEWLVANGFIIKSIAGSSIGALIGGIYATGKLDVYTDWVTSLKKLDMIRLLDVSYRRNCLFKGDRVIGVLRDMIGEHYIEDLDISYTAVATDMHQQKEIWLNNGALFDAIRASIAIPGIFAPHKYLGKHFIDGSLVNPAPIAATLYDKTDITIVVDLNGENPRQTFSNDPPEPDLMPNKNGIMEHFPSFFSKSKMPKQINQSLFDVIISSMETMQNTISRLQLAVKTADVTITIPVDTCSFYEFYRASDMIDLGKEKAAEALSDRFVVNNRNTAIHHSKNNHAEQQHLPDNAIQR